MKKITFLLILLFISIRMNCQTAGGFSLASPNQQLIELAIDGAFLNVEQSYRLVDLKSSRLYGRNGKEEFGKTASVGIKVQKGYIVTDKVVRPWEYDANYRQYEGRYGTKLYKTVIGNGRKTVELDSIDITPCKNQSSLFYIKDTANFNADGLSVNDQNVKGKISGWLVWFVKGNNKKDTVENIIYKNTLEIKENVDEYLLEKPNTSKNILGGIFLLPTRPRIGVVDFKLVGVLVEKMNSWVMLKTEMAAEESKKSYEIKEDAKKPEDISKNELTPINDDMYVNGKSKKRGKGKKK